MQKHQRNLPRFSVRRTISIGFSVHHHFAAWFSIQDDYFCLNPNAESFFFISCFRFRFEKLDIVGQTPGLHSYHLSDCTVSFENPGLPLTGQWVSQSPLSFTPHTLFSRPVKRWAGRLEGRGVKRWAGRLEGRGVKRWAGRLKGGGRGVKMVRYNHGYNSSTCQVQCTILKLVYLL